MQVVTLIANHQQTTNLEALLHEDEQLYCICQQPFDESRLKNGWSITKVRSVMFFIYDSMRLLWYHGDCVGISLEKSVCITAYKCSACTMEGTSCVLLCGNSVCVLHMV